MTLKVNEPVEQLDNIAENAESNWKCGFFRSVVQIVHFSSARRLLRYPFVLFRYTVVSFPSPLHWYKVRGWLHLKFAKQGSSVAKFFPARYEPIPGFDLIGVKLAKSLALPLHLARLLALTFKTLDAFSIQGCGCANRVEWLLERVGRIFFVRYTTR